MVGKATRLCAYLIRNGGIQARGSRDVAVVLAPASGSAAPSSPSGTTGASKNLGSSVLAVVLLALAAIGVITTVRRLRRRRRRDSGAPTTPARNRQPRRLPAPEAPVVPTGNSRPSAPEVTILPVTEPATPRAEEVVRLLAHVRFTQHAIHQFATRAGVPLTNYGQVELVIRELLHREGKVATERPFWSRSSNIADLYLQAGEWMLFILIRDRWLPWRYTCVTAVNGPQENTWENALRRGYIHTPPGAPGLN